MDTRILETVGLATESREAADGLVSVRRPPAKLPIDEAALVREVQSFANVDYVFFRRFDDGLSSQPAAFVIDNTAERLTEGQLAETHHDLWLHGVAPLVYVAWPSRIDVLSCARGPDFWHEGERRYSPAAQIDTASKVATALAERRRFSARRLADGTFWEDPLNQRLANHERAAHESLIRAVIATDKALEGEANPVSRRLLLLTVLVKYLEDRGVFPSPGWFGRFRKGARSFLDVLKGGEPEEVSALLETLEKKFNGDVFSLHEGARLTKTALRSFASLVEARTLGDQRYLWDLYSFGHLPVEVISHLYQRFVEGSTAVYTPPFLASLLLDHAMPYGELTGRERVLDPSCGSGVFLVGAFRRLVNAWRARHRWKTPGVETLKVILRNQIFGVELQAGAVDLTAFSLALAVCDSLQPNMIWSELRFDRLRGSNLREADFFEAFLPSDGKQAEQPAQFDFVVGNPPFESRFTEAAQQVNAAHAAERGEVPDKQVAYLFLDQGLRMLKPHGRLCLIQPSGFLYNLQSHGFRSGIALTGRILAVLDFTSVRGLYEGADPKTVAVLAGETSSRKFLHLTFRRTYRTAQRIGFELDHYDRHRLSVDEVVADPKAARANLLGGGRLAAVAARLRGMRTLAQFVEARGWLMGEGFIEGRSGKQPGEHLTGQPFLPTSALTDEGVDPEDLGTVTATSFYRPGRPELFQPPLVLIRENESLPVAYWDNGPLTYKHEIAGIHAPASERKELHRLFRDLTSNLGLHRFAVLLNSSRVLVGKATAILKNDIEALPYPEDEKDLQLTFWEQVLADDTLQYMAPYVRLGQQSDLLRRKADAGVVREYASLYCRLLGSLYDNLRAGAPVFLDGLTCQPFFFGNKPTIDWLGRLSPDCAEQLSALVFDRTLPALRTVRVVRFYHENVIFIIKPDRLRYWIRSTAIWDADDTLTELRQQGYRAVSHENSHGRITSGVSADAAALKTLDFIERHLAAWRDDPDRPSAERERDLNSQLCKFLNVAAQKSSFGMVHFHHEEPQGARHSADFSANPVDAGWIEGRPYTKYEPILVVEGKRLPTPGSGRQREYVSSAAGEKPGGGVQRFKLGLHGARLTRAGMVGYVQEKACTDWFAEVNRWIDDLASSGDPLWLSDDRLKGFILGFTRSRFALRVGARTKARRRDADPPGPLVGRDVKDDIGLPGYVIQSCAT